MDLLTSVRTKAAGGIRFVHVGFKHIQLLLFEGHASFRGLEGTGQNGVDQFVGEIRFGGCHDHAFFRFPLSVGCDILVNVVDVEQEIVASFHAHLQFCQVNGEGGAVLKNGLTLPIVRSLVFTDTHVGEPTTKRIEFAKRHAGEGCICPVGCGCFSCLDGLGGGHRNLTFEREGLFLTGLQAANGPCDDTVVQVCSADHLEMHCIGEWSRDNHVMELNPREIFHFQFHGKCSWIFADSDRKRTLLRPGRVCVKTLSQRHHLLAVYLVGHGVAL